MRGLIVVIKQTCRLPIRSYSTGHCPCSVICYSAVYRLAFNKQKLTIACWVLFFKSLLSTWRLSIACMIYGNSQGKEKARNIRCEWINVLSQLIRQHLILQQRIWWRQLFLLSLQLYVMSRPQSLELWNDAFMEILKWCKLCASTNCASPPPFSSVFYPVYDWEHVEDIHWHYIYPLWISWMDSAQ